MSEGRFSPRLIASIILAVFFGVALYLRIYLPWDQIFTSEGIKFAGADAYYHMRLVDNLLHNFPHYLTFDPYTFYPNGTVVPWPPFFDWLLAGIIWLVGLGSPTQHTVDVVSVYFPAVLGALVVIPVYFIGKELFNRWAGVISAGLIAILPGEFLARSILGFTDHHVAEVFFTTLTALFLILAIKTAQQRQLSFHHLKHRKWSVVTKPLVYSLLAGIFLGAYLLSWVGGLLFVSVIFFYFVIQFIIDHLKRKSTDYLCLVGVVPFFVALMMFLPVSQKKLYLAALIIALLTPLVLNGLSWLIVTKGIKRVYYPVALVVLGAAGLAILHFVDPSLLKSMLGKFSIFTPSATGLTILEMQPLLFPGGSFTLDLAWGNFTTGSFLSLISLGILIYLVIKQGDADKTLLVVWSLLILAATLGQRRFAYYLAVNMALLTGYLSWRILELVGFKKLIARAVELPTRAERKRAKLKKRGLNITTRQVTMALAVLVIFFAVFFPNIRLATATAQQARFVLSDAWMSSLTWLNDNTPDPFGNPDFYYELYEPPLQGEDYKYPDSAYGIMTWWDYGHWITRIAHRVPISNPFQQGAPLAARFFTAQDENSANEIMDKLNSRYVIIDYDLATGKFNALVTWVGSSPEEFLDVYYLPREGKLMEVWLFHPEYYRSLAVRLYNFDGRGVAPQSSTVVSYEEKVSREGKPYKEITSFQSFPSYEAATAYVLKQKSDNYEIVGTNPFISPVPLEALEHYRLVYSSSALTKVPDVGTIPSIKIFEYVK